MCVRIVCVCVCVHDAKKADLYPCQAAGKRGLPAIAATVFSGCPADSATSMTAEQRKAKADGSEDGRTWQPVDRIADESLMNRRCWIVSL